MRKATIATLVAIIAVAMTSGCIETRSFETHTATAQVTECTIEMMQAHLQDNDITVQFVDRGFALHPDRTVTSSDGQEGTWTKTGTRGGVWSCAIIGIDNVDYISLGAQSAARQQYIDGTTTTSSDGWWSK